MSIQRKVALHDGIYTNITGEVEDQECFRLLQLMLKSGAICISWELILQNKSLSPITSEIPLSAQPESAGYIYHVRYKGLLF